MRFTTLFFTSLLLLEIFVFAVQPDVSGKQHMLGVQEEIAVRDTTYLRYLNELSRDFIESNQLDSARIYIDQALHLAEVLNDLEGKAFAINNLGFYYMDRGLPDSVVRLLDDNISTYQGTNREIQLGNLLANAHNMLGNFTRGLEIYLQTKELAENEGEKRMLIGITQNIGNNYKSLGDVPAAIDSYLTSLEMAEEINDTMIVAVILDNLGSVNVDEGNFDLGEEYLYRALEMNIQIGNLRNQITNHMSLGGLYKDTGRFTEAQESYDRVLELSKELGNTLSRIQALYNLGLLNVQMKEFDSAMEFFEESHRLSIENNILIGSYFNQNGMAGVFSEKGEHARAIELYEAALEIAENVNAIEMIRGTVKNLHENYAAFGDSAKAYNYLMRYSQLTDSLSQTSRQEALARQESLLGLRTERERSELLQETIRAQRTTTIISLILSGVIIVALFTTILLLYKKRNANMQLKKQSEKLHNVNEMKDRLLSVLSHDLRTPITNIKGVLYMIRENLLNKEDIEKVLGEIDYQLEQDIHTLTNYLQWAQTQRDGIKATLEPHSVADLLQSAVTKFTQAADKKGIDLKTYYDDRMYAMADKQMLAVIMRNLLSNAVKYVDPGKEIVVRATQRSNKIYISVEDNGKGIPYNLQPLLFQPFAKVDGKMNDNEIGTGLGLSICKDFAEKMGGDLTFESKPGIGTTFTFTLNKCQETEPINELV